LPKGTVIRSFTINLPHGHIFTFKEVDAFIDSVLLKDAKPLAKVSPIQIGDDNGDGKRTLMATFCSDVPIVKVELIGAVDDGVWQKRNWVSVPATIDSDKVSVILSANLTAYCLLLTDERGLRVSSPVVIP
jgi:hypothetical protein